MKTGKRLSIVTLLAAGVLAAASQVAVAPQAFAAAPGPQEIKKCQVIGTTGSFVLINNLPGPGGLLAGGDCLDIQADFVSVDLDGFMISGGIVGEGITDNGVTRRGTAVHNGTIAGFNTGVSLLASRGTIVEGLRVADAVFRGISVGEGSIV